MRIAWSNLTDMILIVSVTDKFPDRGRAIGRDEIKGQDYCIVSIELKPEHCLSVNFAYIMRTTGSSNSSVHAKNDHLKREYVKDRIKSK